ncbi:MAG TPA: hypothetical protein HPQ04_03620 [Rhodospirillaceae bacterium]|nr:hypothetical protein [Rhodospirillaceae bacterium]
MSRPDADVAVRFLRALAFEIHRKRPPDEAMVDCIEKEGQRGRHRMLRPAGEILRSEGFLPALRTAGFISDEAASILSAIVAGNDHRLLAAAINSLADFHERS